MAHPSKWRAYVPAFIAFNLVFFTLLSYFVQDDDQRRKQLHDNILYDSTSTQNQLLLSQLAVVALGQPSLDGDWNGSAIFQNDRHFLTIGVVPDSKIGRIFLQTLTASLNLTRTTVIACTTSSSCSRLFSFQDDIFNASTSHVYFDFRNGTTLLFVQLFKISPKHYFVYGLPKNVTSSIKDYRTNRCPPGVCAAIFEGEMLLASLNLALPGSLQRLSLVANNLLKHSRFAPCLKQNVSKLNNVFLVGDSPKLAAPQVWAVRELFRRYKMPLVLEGGTLLGWYRNCSVVWDDVDVDLSVPSFAVNNAFYQELVRKAYDDRVAWKEDSTHPQTNSNLSLKSTRIFGDVTYGVEVRFDVKDLSKPSSTVGIDVFVLYLNQPNAEFSYVQGFVTWEQTIMQYALPKNITLCSAIFFGDIYLVPCEPEPYLESHYGKDWMMPKGRVDSYWRTQPNIFRRVKLSQLEWAKRQMFKSFEYEQ